MVAQLHYAVDSVAWAFETNLPDQFGQFGLTTHAINGLWSCRSAEAVPTVGKRVGLTGYSVAECYCNHTENKKNSAPQRIAHPDRAQSFELLTVILSLRPLRCRYNVSDYRELGRKQLG